MNQKTADYLVISFLTLRKAIGCLGMALPFALVFGGLLLFRLETQSSLSGYYHTGMRDVFVGTLCAIGVYLWGYKGYSRQDNRLGNLAGSSAIGVALFPTTPLVDPSPIDKIIGGAHFVFAASFFITLAYMALFLFTKSDRHEKPTPKKRQRNVVYRICGSIILVAMGLLVVYGLLPDSIASRLESLDPVFWLESIAIVAFGVSWFVKGEGILKDRQS